MYFCGGVVSYSFALLGLLVGMPTMLWPLIFDLEYISPFTYIQDHWYIGSVIILSVIANALFLVKYQSMKWKLQASEMTCEYWRAKSNTYKEES